MIDTIFIIAFALLLGVLAGTFTGLSPGIHINLIAAIAASFYFGDPVIVSCFIVAMAIAHTFLDFVPAVFLGAPEDDGNVLSVLPGHRLLLKGYGYAAVKLTLIGSFFGLIIAIAILPLYTFIIKNIFDLIKNTVPFVILAISIFMMFGEKKGLRIYALMSFLLSGILGLFTFSFKPISQPLLPLLTSLFGLPLLFLSIKNKVRIIKQKITELKLNKKEKIKPIAAGVLASGIVSLYPAVGPGQAAIIGSEIFGKLNTKEFLILLGSINTIVMLFSFVTAYAIGKARSGSAAAVHQIIGNLTISHLLLFIFVALLAGILSFFVCVFIAKLIAKKIEKINYSLICLYVLIFVIIVNLAVSGIFSFFVLLPGFFIGLLANIEGIKKIHMMGCLVIPTVCYYFF